MSDVDPYGQGYNITTLTDAPNAEALARALAGLGSMAGHTVLWFSDAAERSATLTGPAAPIEGMATVLLEIGQLDIWHLGAWKTINPPVTTSNTGATAVSGFTVVSFSAYRDGHTVTINACWSRTSGNIEADDIGNIADTPIGKIPTAWAPPEMIYASVGDGFGAGECSIASDGTVTIRAWSTNSTGSSTGGIVTDRNLRVTSTFIKP